MFEHVEVNLGYDDITATTLESGRTYHTPQGDYPSITTVLSILSRDGIQAWRDWVGEEEADKISFQAANRGTDVHEIAEKYLRNNPDFKKGYLPHIIQSFLNLKPILDNRIGKIYGLEVPLYSKFLHVAGRVDCVAEFDGVLSIIDFKTSRRPKKKEKITNYFIQESSYAIMWEERTGIPIKQLVTIMDVDGHEPLVFIEDRDNWTMPLLKTIKQFREENNLDDSTS